MSDVVILNAGLEDDDLTDQIVIRGRIDQTTLKYIRMDWYQREQGFSEKHVNGIVAAYFGGQSVPDITIGMRGQRVKSDKSTYMLQDKCYCIDGGQRLYSAALAQKERPDIQIKLGAKIYLGTTEEFENELFCRLGTTQVRIAASVLIRNKKKVSRASAAMINLNHNPAFALKDRVAWGQRRSRFELIPGFTFASIVGALHSHLGGGLKSTKTYQLLEALDVLVEKIGEENLDTNMIRFFNTIDRCWTIRQLSGAQNEPRPHLNRFFLLMLAALFSSYSEFWDGKTRFEFNCMERYLKKLKTFPLSKYIPRATVDNKILFELMRKHLGLNPTFEDMDEAAE